MKGGRKGQFYIIAAVVIIVLISGFIALRSNIETEEKTRVYDLNEELNIETGYVYDYGIYNSENTSELISEWGKTYRKAVSPGSDETWILVYGNENNVSAVWLAPKETGSINLGGANKDIEQIISSEEGINASATEKEVNIVFKDFRKSFKLRKGQNFFSIIKEKGYVASEGEENEED